MSKSVRHRLSNIWAKGYVRLGAQIALICLICLVFVMFVIPLGRPQYSDQTHYVFLLAEKQFDVAGNRAAWEELQKVSFLCKLDFLLNLLWVIALIGLLVAFTGQMYNRFIERGALESKIKPIPVNWVTVSVFVLMLGLLWTMF